MIKLRFKLTIHYVDNIPLTLHFNEYIADVLCERNRMDLLKSMNHELFYNNKHWVDSKLMDGYEILPHCSESVKIRIDKYYYIEYIKNEKSGDLIPPANFFTNNKEVISSLLSVNGIYLKYGSRWFRADPEIVSLALYLNGLALEFADESLKSRKDIVLIAVKSNGLALEFASQGLRSDKEVVLAALKSNKGAIKYIDSKFTEDEDILKLLS